MAVFAAIERHYAKRPELARRINASVQMLMQGHHPSDWRDDAIASAYCRQYLNGF